MTAPTRPSSDPVQTTRLLVGTIAWGTLTFTVVLWFIRQTDAADTEPWLWALAVGIPVVLALVARTIARSANALDPSQPLDQQRRQAIAQLGSRSLIGAVLVNSGAALWVAIGMVVKGSLWPAVTACLLCTIGVLWAAWPTTERLRAVEQSLNRNGAHIELAPR